MIDKIDNVTQTVIPLATKKLDIKINKVQGEIKTMLENMF